MKFLLILSPIVALMLLIANSYAIKDPSEIEISGGSSLADALIEQSQAPGSYERTNPGFPATPFESRKLEENKSLIWTPMPSSLTPGKGMNPKQARAVSEDQISAQKSTPIVEKSISDSKDRIDAEDSVPNVKENRVAGSWSFMFNDTEPRQIILTLFQIEDAIFGSGSINNGDDTLVASASGSLQGDKLGLDINSIGTIGLYRLSATVSNDAASGTYKMYSANGQIGDGDAQGTRILPMD